MQQRMQTELDDFISDRITVVVQVTYLSAWPKCMKPAAIVRVCQSTGAANSNHAGVIQAAAARPRRRWDRRICIAGPIVQEGSRVCGRRYGLCIQQGHADVICISDSDGSIG